MGLQKNLHVLLDGVAANAAEASRTAEVNVINSASIGFSMSTTRVAHTAISMTIFKSADGGTTYARVPSVAVSAGAGTASDYTVTKTTAVSDTLWIDTGCESCTNVRVVCSATAGGATDLITLKACSGVY